MHRTSFFPAISKLIHMKHVLNYRCIALGCSDPTLPEGVWKQRSVDTLLLGCQGSDTAAWQLTCTDNGWRGTFGDCLPPSELKNTPYYYIYIYSITLFSGHSFICSLVCSFICSLVCSFIRSFVHSFVRSFIHLFVRSLVHLFTRSFVHLFICSLVCSFIRSFVLSFVCSFVHLFTRSFVHSLFINSVVLFFYITNSCCRSTIWERFVQWVEQAYYYDNWTTIEF